MTIERWAMRRATAANWASENPILAEGELGFEVDTGKAKVGDASTEWADLAYTDLSGFGARISTLEATGATGASVLAAADLATTANITLTGEQTIDGITTSTSRILVKDQSDSSENGVYVTASSAWSRATDLDEAAEFTAAAIFVNAGTENAGRTYQQFETVAAVGADDVNWRLVKDESGLAATVATKADQADLDLKTDQSDFAAAVETFTNVETDPVVGGIMGDDSKAVLQVRASGQIDSTHISQIEAGAAEDAAKLPSISITAADPVVGGFLGDADQSPFQVRASGKIDNVHIARMEGRISTLESGAGAGENWSDVRAFADFLHFLIYGQSLSIGAMATSIRASDATARSWARRFVGGLISYLGTDPDRYASIVNLNETTQETITTGMLDIVRQLLLDEDGIDIATSGILPFASCPGYGGKSAAELSDGTTHFTRLETDVTQAAARASGVSRSYQTLVMPYLQGEQDYTIGTPAATWKTLVRSIREDAQSHAQSVSGIARPLPMLVYQLSQHLAKGVEPTLALAAVELCEDDYIGFATPLYFIPAVDTAHRNADGYYWLGAFFGLSIKRWLWDGIKPVPMSPADVVWSDAFVSLRFPTKVGALAFDTTLVDDPGDYGFRLYEADGTTAVTIDSVSIAGDRVIVRATIPGGARLRYAWEGGADDDLESPREGPTNGARGCLRDSRGTTLIADPNGSAFPLHQFAPIFEEIRP